VDAPAQHRIWNLFIRLYVAALLLLAATSKAWLIHHQHLARLSIFQIAFEAILGLWLASGIFSNAAIRITIACFTIFVLINAYKSFQGIADCNCFGPLSVRPELTLAIDLAVLASLIGGRPGKWWGLRISLIVPLLVFLTLVIAIRIRAAL
jgi:hypothetical protein